MFAAGEGGTLRGPEAERPILRSPLRVLSGRGPVPGGKGNTMSDIPSHSLSGALILAAICSLLLAGTIARNPLFLTESGLWAETVRSSPGKQRSHHNLGCALAKERRYEEALRAFDAALTLAPDGTLLLHFCHLEVGNANYHLKRYDDAVAAWRKALGLSPGNPEVLTNIAVVLVKQGKFDEALNHARLALAASPPLAETFEVLGDISLARGDVRAAADHYVAAVKRKPALVSAFRSAAIAFERTGDYDTASRYLEQYIAGANDPAEKGEALRVLESIRGRAVRAKQKGATP